MKEIQGSIITKMVKHSIRVEEGQIVWFWSKSVCLRTWKQRLKIKFRKKEKLLYMEGVT